MRKSNLTYKQLIELAPKDRPFQIEVETYTVTIILWAFINKDNQINTDLFSQFRINDIDYAQNGIFVLCDKSEKMFTLIDEYRNMYEKPEVLEVGTEVEILESAKDCKKYSNWNNNNKIIDMIGKVFIIESFYDDDEGVSYLIENSLFPYYCVRPVEKVEEKEEEIITVNGKKYKLIEE